jgi:hypothetical protein
MLRRSAERLDLVRHLANTPEQRAHAAAHGARVLARLWADPEWRAEQAKQAGARMRALNATPEHQAMLLEVVRTPEARARSSAQLTAYNKSEAHRQLAAQRGSENLKKLWEDPEFRKQRTEDARERLRTRWQDPAHREGMRKDSRRAMHNRWHVTRGVVKDECEFCETAALNHKVISVELDGCADVYDLTVDEYGNFATSAGVFVHNCDSVEADSFAYKIDDILVSDFVLPRFFDPTAADEAAVKYSFRDKIHAPFALAEGGYEALYVPGQGWSQNTARIGPPLTSDIPFVGARRERRMRGQANWRRSPE